jgi:phosphopantetheine adenylyltransferase
MQFEEHERNRVAQEAAAASARQAHFQHEERMRLLDQKHLTYARFRVLVFDCFQLYSDSPPTETLAQVYGIDLGAVDDPVNRIDGHVNRLIMENLQTIGLIGSAEVRMAASNLARAAYQAPDDQTNKLLQEFSWTARIDVTPPGQ